MKPVSRLAIVALLFASLVRPADAQSNQGHSYRWYWGAQAGGILYRTNAQTYHADPIIGVHWMITRQRGALYIGGEEAFFTSDATATVVDPATATTYTVAFSKVRRLFAGLTAYPLPGHIEPYFGGGVAINTVVDARPNAAAGQPFADDASNKANAFFLGGVQINVGRLAVFGQYLVSTSANNFLLMNEQHTVQGGVRYSLGRSKEDVDTSN